MRQSAMLWLAVLAGPTIWFASMLANFALAPWACGLGWKPALFVVAILALALTAFSGLASWRLWHRVGLELPGESSGAAARDRTLGLAGVLLNSLFFLVILAQAVPNLILRSCE